MQDIRSEAMLAERGERDDHRIKIHGAEAFEGMRRAGRLAAETLDFIAPYIKPGVTTDELDRLCAGFILDRGGISAPLNYRGFPRSICTSLYHVFCTGLPGELRLLAGEPLHLGDTPSADCSHLVPSRH